MKSTSKFCCFFPGLNLILNLSFILYMHNVNVISLRDSFQLLLTDQHEHRQIQRVKAHSSHSSLWPHASFTEHQSGNKVCNGAWRLGKRKETGERKRDLQGFFLLMFCPAQRHGCLLIWPFSLYQSWLKPHFATKGASTCTTFDSVTPALELDEPMTSDF